MIPIFSSHSAIPGDDSLIQVQLQYPEGTGSKSIRACIFWASFSAIYLSQLTCRAFTVIVYFLRCSTAEFVLSLSMDSVLMKNQLMRQHGVVTTAAVVVFVDIKTR